MPYPLLCLFLGPSEIRAFAGPVVTAIVLANYVSGLGADGTPITERDALSLNSRPLVLTLSSTEL